MSDLQYIILVFLVVAGAAVASKPHHTTFDPIFRDSLSNAFGRSGSVSFADTKLTHSISKLKCKSIPDNCESRIKQNIHVEFTNFVVANYAELNFEGHEAGNCLGLANSWICNVKH